MSVTDGRGMVAADRCGRPRTYRLVELRADGPATEAFRAPNDAVALERARAVARGHAAEVWRGAMLIGRWGVDDAEPEEPGGCAH